MAAFTSEQKYGYFDGEHVGNWSNLFPVFARVVNGSVYLVGREDNANGDPARFGKMYFLSRAWLKGAMFNANPSDADLIVDKPNQVEDSSLPGSMFNKTSDTSQVISRPDPSATTTNPPPANTTPTTTPDPTKPVTTPDPTKPATTTTTTPGGTLIQSLTDTTSNVGAAVTKMSSTTWILIAVAAVGALAAIMYFVKKK